MSATSETNAREREPRDLNRESEAIREDLESTLQALQRKFSPEELLDRSIEYVQENGGDILRKVGDTVSKNPLPLLVTCTGLAWLVASSRSSHTRRRSLRPSAAPRSGDFDRASQSFDSTGRGQALKQKAHDALDSARTKASDTWGSARERTREYGDDLSRFVSEQPLACGAIAVAVGAIIGAAFPPTRYERELVSRARDATGTMSASSGDGSQQARPRAQPASPLSH